MFSKRCRSKRNESNCFKSDKDLNETKVIVLKRQGFERNKSKGLFRKKIKLISNRTTIEFNQFNNIRFVVFGKFCFEETKRSHTKTKNEKKIDQKFQKSLFRYRNT